MTTFIRHLLGAAAFTALTVSASATTATFDDIGIAGAVPASYAGLDWSAGGWSASNALQSPYTPHSGSFAAYTNWDATDASSLIKFAAPSTLQGAWFAGLSGATVSFDLYYHGVQVATSTTLDPTSTPTWLASGYAGAIDSLRVSSAAHGSFVMDDLRYSAVAAVPEPQTHVLMLMGVGLLGVIAARRHRSQR